MAREIRISIDDDEVFERMKARKRELDLSWEEVLYRGLRRDERGPHDTPRTPDPGRGGRDPSPAPPDPIDSPGAFADDLKRQIQGQVRESLRESLDPAGWDDSQGGEDPLDEAVDSLAAAEDAVLAFPFLGESAEDPSHRVPLRVRLTSGADGFDVEVVAVRQGKGVTELNSFDRGARQRIVEGLAGGESAVLELEGAEEYRVGPVLTWSRDDAGRPTVTEVAVEEVRFDVD